MNPYNNNLVKNSNQGRVGVSAPGVRTPNVSSQALNDIIERSLGRKAHGTKPFKKMKSMNPKTVAAIVVGGIVFIASANLLIQKGIDSHNRDVQLNNAITYMDENILPDVYANSGFVISGMDKSGEPIYEFSRINGINAVDYLMENYNIDRPTAEFIVAKSLNYDQRLYPEGQTPEEYYASQGYVTGDSLDQYSVFSSPIKTFENMNGVKTIKTVDRIKEEGRTNGTRS